MNLWFRLLQVTWALFRKPGRLSTAGVSIIHLRVWPGDLDTNLHVNNGRYLTLFDLGRFDLLMRLGIWKEGIRRRWIPVLGGALVRFRRSLQLFEPIEIRTRILGWDDRWIYIEQTLWRNTDLIAVAHVRGMFRGPQGGLLVRDVLKILGMDPVSPELPDSIRTWTESEEAMYQSVAGPLRPRI